MIDYLFDSDMQSIVFLAISMFRSQFSKSLQIANMILFEWLLVMVMFLPIICCKREMKNLWLTNGCAGKAICVGEKHHDAWCYPTLNEVANDLFMPVDCLLLLLLTLPLLKLTQLTTPVSGVIDVNDTVPVRVDNKDNVNKMDADDEDEVVLENVRE